MYFDLGPAAVEWNGQIKLVGITSLSGNKCQQGGNPYHNLNLYTSVYSYQQWIECKMHRSQGNQLLNRKTSLYEHTVYI